MQMAICNVKYCDFVVWTLQGIVAIRIGVYPQFIEAVKPKLDKFFVQCVLPNLLVPHKSSDQSLAMDVNELSQQITALVPLINRKLLPTS